MPALGMPGFSTSRLSNALVLLAPAARTIVRISLRVPRVVEMTSKESTWSPKGRLEFQTGRAEGGAAVPVFKASSAITSMARADRYVEIPRVSGASNGAAGADRPVLSFGPHTDDHSNQHQEYIRDRNVRPRGMTPFSNP